MAPSEIIAGRTGRRIVAIVAALTLLATVLPGRAGAAELARYVVAARASLAAASSAVSEAGGTVVDTIEPFGMLVADLPVSAAGAVAADRATAAVTPDAELTVQSVGTEVADAARAAVAHGAEEAAVASRVAVNAPRHADLGAGTGVVLVDTGVADHPDLNGQVVARMDLTEDGDGIDHHGHGTFMAGLVAGTGAAADGAYAGAAPGAHLVSIKVAGADGKTDLSTVLRAFVLADAARDRFDAPVLLLALSGPAGEAPDPVMTVLEMLWSRGTTVVVAAGNDGAEALGSPGVDPYLISVGAIDDNGTIDTGDDAVPTWSAYGEAWGHTRPDLVAPGKSVVSTRAVGSTVDQENASARIGEQYFRGSGTSMSAALTAGAAAAVLAADPSLSPDQVKGRLMGGAAPAPSHVASSAVGAGVLDVAASLASTAGPANTDLAPLPQQADRRVEARAQRLLGQIERLATSGRPHVDRQIERRLAELDELGIGPMGWSWTGWSWNNNPGWTGWSWNGDEWAGWSWNGWSWNGWSWNDHDFAGWSWNNQDFAGWSWNGDSWSGWSWNDNGDWAGWSWNDNGDWAGWSWNGWSWNGWSWNDWDWSTATWD